MRTNPAFFWHGPCQEFVLARKLEEEKAAGPPAPASAGPSWFQEMQPHRAAHDPARKGEGRKVASDMVLCLHRAVRASAWRLQWLSAALLPAVAVPTRGDNKGTRAAPGICVLSAYAHACA